MATYGGPNSQLELLRKARNAETTDIVRYILTAIRRFENEPLHPEWHDLWEKHKQAIIEGELAPTGFIQDIARRVSAIETIDKRIRELKIGKSESICFLLGAGASAPEPSAIPTVKELLPELLKRARKIGRDDIDNLALWCEDNNVTNIEDLLTAAHLANYVAKNSSITGLLNYFLFRSTKSNSRKLGRGLEALIGEIDHDRSNVNESSIALLQDTLQVLFSLLTGTMIPAKPNGCHDAIVDFLRSHSQTSIVTTNYDGCIDEALTRSKVVLRTYAHETNVNKTKKVEPVEAVDLIKMHGSINWFYCDSCHEVKILNLLDLKKAYELDTISYPVIGICRNCGGQRRPLLIPPIGLKFIMFPNLANLWNIARERLEGADYILVVGFSFSEADTYVNKIIERSMIRNNNQRLIICDPDTSLVTNLRNRFAARVNGFNEKRILHAYGSADKIVPEVLKILGRATTRENVLLQEMSPKEAAASKLE